MISVAVMGATGAVGREMLKILDQRRFPSTQIKLLASERSAGKSLAVGDKTYDVELLTDDSFDDVDVILASAGGSVSRQFAPAAVRAGAVMIDNTSAFRMDRDVPLVIPEVNSHAAEFHRGIIANPNCSTIQMIVALAPIHRVNPIRRIIVSTYQAVSGAGAAAITEMENQTRALLNEKPCPDPAKFAHRIAFNALPHIDDFLDNGYTKEEMKMVNETRKILEDESIGVTATTVRVPVYRGHSESINIETESPLSPDTAREILSQAPGVSVIDDPAHAVYPLAIDAAGQDATYVGRIRQDDSRANCLNLWCVSDNLRKGAALNAVQIAEMLLDRNWLKQKFSRG
jgi:aspartate-semialdehyde dehydrogenase